MVGTKVAKTELCTKHLYSNVSCKDVFVSPKLLVSDIDCAEPVHMSQLRYQGQVFVASTHTIVLT